MGPLAPKPPVRHRGPDPYSQPAGSPAPLQPPLVGLPVTLQRVASVLEGLTPPSTGWAQRTTWTVMEHTPHRRAIPAPNLARLLLHWRVPRRGQAAGARGTGRSRRRVRGGDTQRVIALRPLLGARRLRGCGVTALPQPAPFDGPPPPPCAAPRDLRWPVQVEDRLGHSTQQVLVAGAVRHAPTLVGTGRDAGVLRG
jgi:hypothetical protein